MKLIRKFGIALIVVALIGSTAYARQSEMSADRKN